jgi:hypothetical protein
MSEASSYWTPIIELRNQLQCWVRVAFRDGASIGEGEWGQMLLMPDVGYLEGADGPWPLRVIDWVELSTCKFTGGVGGRPFQFIDIKDEILGRLRATPCMWELRQTTWTVERMYRSEDAGFKNMPVELIRIANPFGPS